jgi:hypothetical protein|tara:strand:+ start:1503 stop:1844 length:342 start_codon:yes stop_codon:yes gene_type:complete
MNPSEYNNQKPQLPKKPELNGGLYTGEPFRGPWGNVPVIPEGSIMTHDTLQSANPPEQALTQFGEMIRPGNNDPIIPPLNRFSPNHDIACTQPPENKNKLKSFDHSFNSFASW